MFEFLALALFLGIKHSFDADHLIAVSSLLQKAKSLRHSVQMAISWAIGHMATAVLVTIVLFVFRDSILSFILDKMEMLIAIMLVVLGLASLYQARIFHSHRHVHETKKHVHSHIHLQRNDHTHRHMFGIGIVHGLASNDELLLLLTVSLGLTSLGGMLVGVGVFSLGVVLGMIAFSLFLTYPILKISSEKLNQIVNASIGSISILYGIFLFVG